MSIAQSLAELYRGEYGEHVWSALGRQENERSGIFDAMNNRIGSEYLYLDGSLLRIFSDGMMYATRPPEAGNAQDR
jgi:hypothetical protein